MFIRFELKVTDGGGLFSKDTVQISVNAQPPPECLPTNRPIINAQLIPIGNLSIGRCGMATVTAGNKLFFAGGQSAYGLSSRVDIYDIPSQSWSTAELSVPRLLQVPLLLAIKYFLREVFLRWYHYHLHHQE